LNKIDHILSVRCAVCGDTIRTTLDHPPIDTDRIYLASNSGWGMSMQDDDLMFLCSGPACAGGSVNTTGTLHRWVRSLIERKT
jgi:hypothetical protein